ncbi:MAG TPA: thioesterase family protein [Chloroflexia bacterium]|nr:thioesterase family protein [Chloroflexia bacterium]
MVREYRWRFTIRSYEGDAWGQLSAAGLLRYFEQSAVEAAADAGYGSEFHDEHGSAWVIRRMSLLMQGPMMPGQELEIATWISHFGRVRGGREYRVSDAASGKPLASGLAEWVYVDRHTLSPKAIPKELAIDFDTPGAPLGTYDAPPVVRLERQPEFTVHRVAEWHEADSLGHVNNAIYADWLDDATRAAIDAMGWNTATLRDQGLQLRGEHYSLDYRRGAIPGDHVTVTTRIEGISGRLYAIRQRITDVEGLDLVANSAIYGWRTTAGEPTDPPEGWTDEGSGIRDQELE